MIDETADAIILRWPKARQPVEAGEQHSARLRRRLLSSLPIFVVRVTVECIGWLAVIGFIAQL